MNCKRIIAALLCAVIPFGIADLSAAAPIALYAEAATVTAGGTCGICYPDMVTVDFLRVRGRT